jgi:hypothetical protein
VKIYLNEGQIVYSNGSASEDRTCTCDYRAGYAFLREPAGKCFCSPSVEDCSCYKKTDLEISVKKNEGECKVMTIAPMVRPSQLKKYLLKTK